MGHPLFFASDNSLRSKYESLKTHQDLMYIIKEVIYIKQNMIVLQQNSELYHDLWENYLIQLYLYIEMNRYFDRGKH